MAVFGAAAFVIALKRSSESLSAKPRCDQAARCGGCRRAFQPRREFNPSIAPCPGADPIASMMSRGILTALEISRDNPVLSTDKRGHDGFAVVPPCSSLAANKRLLDEREIGARAVFLALRDDELLIASAA